MAPCICRYPSVVLHTHLESMLEKEEEMNRKIVRLIAVAICLIALSFGFDQTRGAANPLNYDSSKQAQAAACGKCGDGQCVRQCGENERTCPRDCAVTSTGEKNSVALARQ